METAASFILGIGIGFGSLFLVGYILVFYEKIQDKKDPYKRYCNEIIDTAKIAKKTQPRDRRAPFQNIIILAVKLIPEEDRIMMHHELQQEIDNA